MSGRHLHLHAGVEPALDWTAGSQPPLMPESISNCTHACRLLSHARGMRIDMSTRTEGVFSFLKKIVLSNQMFGHMHRVLNINKKITNYTYCDKFARIF
jgi:hypothetical protein